MESRKAHFKSRGPTAEIKRLLKAEEVKKRHREDRREKLMSRRDLQRSPLSERQEEVTISKKSHTEEEKRLTERLAQWKKAKDLERKKKMLHKQRPFILGSTTNVIPKSPLPLPRVPRRKVNDEAKPIIARRSTRLQDKLKSTTCMKPWTTNDKRVGQRGKKNPQTSDFAKKASESGLTTQ
jgi:hypothetical protein